MGGQHIAGSLGGAVFPEVLSARVLWGPSAEVDSGYPRMSPLRRITGSTLTVRRNLITHFSRISRYPGFVTTGQAEPAQLFGRPSEAC
jgi:hypothetical protein